MYSSSVKSIQKMVGHIKYAFLKSNYNFCNMKSNSTGDADSTLPFSRRKKTTKSTSPFKF